jgi:hypothetical protein
MRDDLYLTGQRTASGAPIAMDAITAIRTAQAVRAATGTERFIVLPPANRQRAPGKWTYPAVLAMIHAKTWSR